jgi:hypothetical protein
MAVGESRGRRAPPAARGLSPSAYRAWAAWFSEEADAGAFLTILSEFEGTSMASVRKRWGNLTKQELAALEKNPDSVPVAERASLFTATLPGEIADAIMAGRSGDAAFLAFRLLSWGVSNLTSDRMLKWAGRGLSVDKKGRLGRDRAATEAAWRRERDDLRILEAIRKVEKKAGTLSHRKMGKRLAPRLGLSIERSRKRVAEARRRKGWVKP